MANSNRKGKDAERELAHALRAVGFVGARRGRQYQGSPESPDVVGIPGIHIEAKRYKRIAVCRWMDKALTECSDKPPVVMMREDQGEWMTMNRLVDLWAVAERMAAATGKPIFPPRERN